jgi:urease accessory protein
VAPELLSLVQAGTAPGTYPAGLGAAFAGLGSPEEDAFAVHQRLMRIDHRQVQAIFYTVNSKVSGDYADVRQASLSDMASFAPVADVLASIHVQSHVRLFMN